MILRGASFRRIKNEILPFNLYAHGLLFHSAGGLPIGQWNAAAGLSYVYFASDCQSNRSPFFHSDRLTPNFDAHANPCPHLDQQR